MASAGLRTVSPKGQRVAVVGSGISGLSAAWLLHESGFDVTIFEKEATCGGHTLTDDSAPVPVDLGFQVFNFTNYPNLVGFLDALGVDSEPSDMSFALSVDGGRLEWASFGLHTIFAQRRNLLRPSFYLMIADVLRFNRKAPEVLKSDKFKDVTLGQYLKRGWYSRVFCSKYLLPMCAAIWSVPTASVLEFPVQMLVQFWVNHHLLSLLERPLWRVVSGRSRTYVNAVLAAMPDSVCVNSEVIGIDREAAKVRLTVKQVDTDAVRDLGFDHVVLACHSDQSLAILGKHATSLEREVLEGIPYSMNDVYLHGDEALMPRIKACWASWNCLEDTSTTREANRASLGQSERAVCVTYWLNHLQNLPNDAPTLLCTLNPTKKPDPQKVYRHLRLGHPIFGPAAVPAQEKLPSIQGRDRVWFAGAWSGYGFHEDGLKAGIAVATGLGATVPWTPRSTSPNMTLMDRVYIALFTRFGGTAITRGVLRILLPDGSELKFGKLANATQAAKMSPAMAHLSTLTATLRIMDVKAVARIVKTADIGLGEAFMLREIETDDLLSVMWVMSGNAKASNESLKKMSVFNWAGMTMAHVAHKLNANTLSGSRRNIAAHYDAGNAMYQLFLDQTMMYSAAVHTPAELAIASGGEYWPVDLHAAQLRKLDTIIARAGIAADHHVLEIGCGWGAFAIRAAQTTGCKVLGITISKEQLVEAQARVQAAGLKHLVDLRFCDYRHLPNAQGFDRVVSIEMIEAVGHEHLDGYFDIISRNLKPAGKAVIQVITRKDEGYAQYTHSSDFIRAHIFPGGHLPCMAAMIDCAGRATVPMVVDDCKDIGLDYAVTLHEWRERWNAQHPELLALGYDDVFIRKYDFYFAYCEAAFAVQYIHDYIITWKPKDAGDVSPVEALAPATDSSTQLILLVYIFLCGVCVGRVDGLWLAPIAAVACIALHKGLAGSGRPSAPRLLWASTIVDFLFSCGTSSVLVGHLLQQRTLPPATDATQQALLCCALGFYTYKLWWKITHTQLGMLSILSLVGALVCFGSAVVKRSLQGILVLTLVSELNSVVTTAATIAQISGRTSVGRALATISVPSFVLFRLLPHAAMMVFVYDAWDTLSAPAYTFVLGFGGLIGLNAVNMHLFLGLLKPATYS